MTDEDRNYAEADPIRIDPDLCTLCEACMDACIARIFQLSDSKMHAVDPLRCLKCGHCMAICPAGAIRVAGLDPNEFEPIQEPDAMPDPERLMGLFRRRRSMRRYQKRPVERHKIERIIEAGRFAPTGGNRQPFSFSVVQNPETLLLVKRSVTQGFVDRTAEEFKVLTEKVNRGTTLSDIEIGQHAFAEKWRSRAEELDRGIDRLLFDAPVLISLYAPSEYSGFTTEAGLVGMQMVLMAEALGLGTCFIGWIAGASVGIGNSLPEVKKAMNIPEHCLMSLALVVGYSDLDYIQTVSRAPAKVAWA